MAVQIPGHELVVTDEHVERMARGRAVIDFVASLTDDQAAALLEALSGRTTQLWSDQFVL